MRVLALLMTFATVVMPAASQTPAQNPAWKTFTNRAGWSIQYPANWRVGSCHSCTDPAEGNVFVTFSNPDRATDSVMIEHLRAKPADKDASQWLQELGKRNTRTGTEELLIDGMPALKVRNRNLTGRESESVYVIRDSATFEITIYDDNVGERIQDMSIYPIYQHMLSTFRFTQK